VQAEQKDFFVEVESERHAKAQLSASDRNRASPHSRAPPAAEGPEMSKPRLLPALPAAVLAAALLVAGCGGASADEALSFAWPPVLGEPYPSVVLQDSRGRSVELASFRGKVLLIEPIGMT
jgi:anti-sigma factor RsiW